MLFLEPREYMDHAIVGVATRAGGLEVLAYDKEKVLEALMADGEMNYEEALEYFDFNTAGAWVGEDTPVFIDAGWVEYLDSLEN
jgi:hypothetical protein